MRFPVAKFAHALKIILVPCVFGCIVFYGFLSALYRQSLHGHIEIGVSNKPIFVIKTYYYPNSKTFNGSDAVVTLFNGESFHYSNYTFACWRLLKDGTIERSVGKVLDLKSSPGVCKLAVLRLTCLFPPKGLDIAHYSVGVVSEGGMTKFQRLTVSKPNTKPYKFVSCMSRMVAVDDWAMLIFAMETFRYFGGDLAVAPVECAIKEVMDLLRLYEKDGILKVQPAYKPKQIPELDYNPLFQTEYANQISNSHECFYDFKESAEFISFPDWDDILVGYRQENGFKSYYDMFSPLVQQQPNAAAFSIERFNTAVLTPIHESEEFSLAKTLKSVAYHVNSSDHKMILRPHLVAGSWIHSSKVLEDAAHYEVNATVAFFSHLHYTLLTKDNATAKPGNSNKTFVDPEAFELSFNSMLKRHSIDFKNSDYPFIRVFYGIISGCYRQIALDFGKDGVTYCPTPATCKYDTQNVTVVKAKTWFKESFTSGPFIWVERSHTEFFTDNKGCL